jgi:hypothetical protein
MGLLPGLQTQVRQDLLDRLFQGNSPTNPILALRLTSRQHLT